VLAAVVVVVLGFGDVDGSRLAFGEDVSVHGVLQAAGLLFFAFAGYARIATLGEEVRDPARTITRAIPIALGITLVVYALVAVAVLSELGSAALASTSAPLAEAVRAAGFPGMEPVVRVGAAVAALGSLLALILGVSRTTLAMARDRHLPHALSAVHPRFKTPHHAEIVVGVVVAAVAAVADVRGAIGFSSFAVLLYYAIANASAWTLEPEGRRHQTLRRRSIPFIGLIGCLVLAFLLPVSSVLIGAAVVAVGVAAYVVRASARPASGS
jgi:basic amino acid/polyamine antiporter, APA family